jgi:flagellar hook-length control protein FliK
MADFAFDATALVLPPAPAVLPPPASAGRSNGRFEEHLGSAARPPRSQSPGSSQRPNEQAPSAKSTDGADNTSENDSSQPADDDGQRVDASNQGQNDDGEQDANAPGDPADANAAAQAAAGQAGAKSPQRHADKHGESEADEVSAADNTIGDHAIGSTKKGARGRRAKRAGGVDDASATGESATAPTDGKDSAVGEDSRDGKDADAKLDGAVDGALNAIAQSPAEAATNAGVAGVAAVPAATNGQSLDGSGEGDSQDALAATEPVGNTGSVGRARAKTVAASAAGKPGDDGFAVAADSLEAAAEISGTGTREADEASTGHDQPRDEKTQPDRNETGEPRLGAAPALLAARNEKGHDPNGRTDGLTEAERARFVQRVASAFRSLGDEGGELRLRLSPPELGSLRVELSVRDGVLNARLETETSSARNLLLDNLPALRDRLAEQNIKVEKFDVDVRDERRQSAGEQFTGQPDHGGHHDRQRPRQFGQGITTATTTRLPRAAIKHGDGSELNIVI